MLITDTGPATQDKSVKMPLHFYLLSGVSTRRKCGYKSKSGLLSQAVREQSSCKACFLVTAKEEQKYFLSSEKEIGTCSTKASFVRWKVKLKN